MGEWSKGEACPFLPLSNGAFAVLGAGHMAAIKAGKAHAVHVLARVREET